MQRVSNWIPGIVLMLISFGAKAQDSTTLTLEKAYQLAQQNYPLIKQKDLVRQTATLSIENLVRGFLPQLTIAGQATYQSRVTSVPVKIPGIDIEDPAKDQYKITAEATQLLYDGVTLAQKKIQQVNALVEEQRAEVDLYKLKERINTFYLGVLLFDEQLRQVELVKKDIELGIKRVSAQVQNGTAFRSNQLVLEAELLKNDQRRIELRANRKGLLDMFSLFINQQLPENTKLETPVSELPEQSVINRPEIKLFSYQDSLLRTQRRLVNAKNMPRASLFIQGGYGRPGLNMLENKFDFFYIGGLRFNWSLGGLYTSRREKDILEINQRMVEVQKDIFVLNTNTQLKQQEAELEKLEQLIVSDQQIIALRVQVKDAANAQLTNGVITANDYLREVYQEDQARLSLITHELQLLQARINYQTIAGNQ